MNDIYYAVSYVFCDEEVRTRFFKSKDRAFKYYKDLIEVYNEDSFTFSNPSFVQHYGLCPLVQYHASKINN